MKINKILPDSSISKVWEKFRKVDESLGGYSFYNNPMVVYIISDNMPYEDENGNYIFANSDTGKSMLANTEIYTSNRVNGSFYRIEGADSVNPFKGKVNLAELTVATATAADITEGKLAWVNGELVTGTRPAPVNSQSGSMYINAPGKNATGTSGSYSAVTYHALTFPTPFDTVPKVSTTYSGSERVICRGATNITKTGCQFIIASDRGSTYGITVYWTATT